jgi:hypothetical protein
MSQELNEDLALLEELKKGGDWLKEARTWIQWHVVGGDMLTWSSPQPVTIPFFKLEEFALSVAMAAIKAERRHKSC